jgi:putative sugar O-methyltransferase
MSGLDPTLRERLEQLLAAYRQAPETYQATRYWARYEEALLRLLPALDPARDLRSPRHSLLGTFGFRDAVYFDHPDIAAWKRAILRPLQWISARESKVLPYRMNREAIEAIGWRHAELAGKLAGLPGPETIAASTWGGPESVFYRHGRPYTLTLLSCYLRLCFVHQHRPLRGDEVVVELGSGAGTQLEVLAQLFPGMTLLAFDLPGQLALCETYLRQALPGREVVGAAETLGWTSLEGLRPGAVHFFGNWKMPLLRGFGFDLFWNAASFGEMEPAVVRNYLADAAGARSVYLLQARRGKESAGAGRSTVEHPIRLEDYQAMLGGYRCVAVDDAWHAHRPLDDSGGYFQGVWLKQGGARG